jgi:hypothetical protein
MEIAFTRLEIDLLRLPSLEMDLSGKLLRKLGKPLSGAGNSKI